MADNTTVYSGQDGTAINVATDEVGGVEYQRVKLVWGVDGTVNDANASTPLPVDINSLPAANKTTDSIAAVVSTDAVMNGLTALTPKFASIACHTSGANDLIAAVSAKTIRVVSLFLVASAAVNIYFVDTAGSPVALAGNATDKIQLAANGGFVLPFNPAGWFQTSTTNVKVQVNLSGAIGVAGAIQWLEV